MLTEEIARFPSRTARLARFERLPSYGRCVRESSLFFSSAVGERRYRYRDQGGNTDLAGAAIMFAIGSPDDNQERASQVAMGRARLNYDFGAVGQARRGFSSVHPGGAVFCLADGSVDFIGETIEFGPDVDGDQWSDDQNTNTVYERLIAIADGQPVGR